MAKVYRPENSRKVLVAVADLFNEIFVLHRKKTPPNTEAKVSLTLATTEKLITFLSKDDKTKLVLPAMGLDIISTDLDEERIMNPANRIINGIQYVLQPVPYNYTIDLAILGNRSSQVFELLEQIIPFFQKARYYPLKDFVFSDGSIIKRDLAVELVATPLDLQVTEIVLGEQQVHQCTLSFIAKGWVYGTNPTLADTNNGLVPITSINIDFQNEFNQAFESLEIGVETGGDTFSILKCEI